MKSRFKIIEAIIKLNDENARLKTIYSGLGQCEMLSQAGNDLEEEINSNKGKIKALMWVLHETEELF